MVTLSDPTPLLGLSILGVLGLAIILLAVFKAGKFFQSSNIRVLAYVLGGFMLVSGGAIAAISSLGGGLLAAGTTSQTDATSTAATGQQFGISRLTFLANEKYSNDRSVVDGYIIRVFDENADPTDANQAAIVNATFTDGVVADTSRALFCGKPYRVITDDNNDVWYAEDLNKITFPCSSLNLDNGELTYDTKIEALRVSTLDDILDETATSGIINGQTNNTMAAADNAFTILIGEDEARTAAADDAIVYDESVGSGTYYIEPTFSATGANTGLKNYATCYRFDSTDPPEGTEITSISVSSISGDTGKFNMVAEQVNLWKNQQCSILASELKGGTSGKFRFTVSVSEANLDPQDVWFLDADDLSKRLGLDVGQDDGATADRIRFNATA